MKNYFKKIAFSVLMVSSLLAHAGQIQPISGILRTNGSTTITVGDPNATVIVEQTSLPSAGVTADYNVVDLISLNLDNATTHFFNTPTSFNVELAVETWNVSGTSTTLAPFTLTVSTDSRYNKQTIDRAIKKLTNAYKLEITITGITQTTSAGTTTLTTLPDYLFVEGEINMIRYTNFTGTAPVFNPTGITPLDIDCDGTPDDELKVQWGTVTGAEEYQLEWSFVNDYGVTGATSIPASSLFADFKNNSTRITTAALTYNLSLLFEKGYIAFRVRGVGRDYLNPEKFIYGNWSSGAIDIVNIGSLSSTAKYHNILDHEGEKNWQYAVTFAEEGKKKEVISYFDGSLHNRQSVTKVNSDNNVIVGETIYDYQGRPAINVLPSPVTFPSCSTSYVGPSLKYYYKYNRDVLGNTYSKDDFDHDYLGTCSPSALGMDSVSGSSQYYSASNPNKLDFQAFVPRAEMFPFSQIEYTPDNTGRIRSQSGVGKQFQLGSKHETKYFYSQPNQIQLDRLFGSEVGDAAHYKKNTVIDANGQVSVSYLNQEGKTIATALAGEPPIANTVVYMEPLASAATAAVALTVDAFNKDANGNSLSNTVTPLEDGISFSTQLSVSYNSNYSFSYDLLIDTLYDQCIVDKGFCISCIYDLEIKVVDECGVNLLGASTVNKRIGHLEPVENGFTMNCTSPSETNETDAFSIALTPGVYTVSKVLTINKDARDYYVQKYLDPAFNDCIKSEADFIEEALANVDTSACNVTCETCALALGNEDDFVASGRGTSIQYQYLLDQCLEPCRPQTLCSNSFDMMLVDVSPGGQYGKFNPSTLDASGEVYSVFNHTASNYLPSYNGAGNNILPASTGGNWRYPALIMNGTVHKMYLDDTGDRVKVNVFPTSTVGVWSPAVQSGAVINTEPGTGQTYVYPENLQNLSDFMAVWNINFAKSLVLYHPEYAYYIACKDQEKIPAGLYSTEGIDSLMIVTNTFADAITAGFIDATTLQPVNLLVPPVLPAHASDPFFAHASSYNDFYGPFNSYYITTTPYNNATNLVGMAVKMNNYLDVGTIPGTTFLSMMQTAAAQARCGNNFSGPTGAACTSFGTDYFPNPGGTDLVLAAMNDSIRNQEWQFFKNFYMSEKHKFQFLRMDFFAKNSLLPVDPNMPSTNIIGGCNACIGNTSYNPFGSGMYTYSGGIYTLMGSPAYDPSQPCSFSHFFGFNNVNFTKRFVDPANTGLNPALAEYNLFQQTGQCPIAYKLTNFMTELAQGHNLYPAATTLLGGISTFGPDLYTAVSGGTYPPTSYVNYRWDVVSATVTDLMATITDPTTSTVKATLNLDISGSPITDFTKIVSFQHLRYTTTTTTNDNFKVQATYLTNTAGATATVEIPGKISFDIHGCQFEPVCTPNQLALDFMNLTNIAKAVGFEGSTYAMSANTTVVAPAIGNTLKTQLGTPNTDLYWNFVPAGSKVEIYDNANPTTKLVFTIISATPASAIPNIVSYANIKSNFNNLFKMDGLDAFGNVIVSIEGKAEKVVGSTIIDLSMGECGLPPVAECNTPSHQAREDLEALFNEILTQEPFVGNINLFNYPTFTPTLQTYIAPTSTETHSVYTSDNGATTSFDNLYFDGLSCELSIHHDLNHPNAIAINFSDIIAVNNLTGIPPLDANGDFHNFYFIATYQMGGSAVSDTVWGKSCVPIRNCDVCLSEQELTGIDKLCKPQALSAAFGLYNTFLNTVATYNASVYATEHSHTVTPPDFGHYILQLNTSTCYITYNTILQNYSTLPSGSTAPLPRDTCSRLFTNANCDNKYAEYMQAVYEYNAYAATVGYVQITHGFTLECFNEFLCACSDRFTAGLTSVINGNVAYPASNPANFNLPIFHLELSCDLAVSMCDVPDTAFVFPPMPYSPNPCVVQAIAAATQNAINQYNLYADSAATDFITRYNAHCLRPVENLHYTYTDKEYHFTLYYYDQAGNLVKTIPPEGIEFLPITSPTSPLEMQVKQDRINNTQTVYTSHRMATTYEYNSLNQLVRQDMPDHDKMDICESILPNGLDADLTITSMQYVNASKGFLIGHLTRNIAGTNIDRGYMYTTNNGGQSWSMVTGLSAGDIKKVQMVSTTEGFAVSNYGIIFKTLDGGASWDAITTLYNSPTQYFGDLNDLYFNSTTTGIVGGISNGVSGGVYKTTNGGLNWTAGTGFSTNDTITGLTFDGTNYYASVKKLNHGKMYVSVDGITWTAQTNYTANDLKKVQYMNNNDTAFAVGIDGTLLRSNSANSTWELLATNSPYNFSDIYFKNGREGIALIETSTVGKYAIYKTFDAGKNWALLSDPGKYYSSLQAYDPVFGKVIAAGDAGNVAKVLISLPPFGMTDISHNLSTASSPANLSYAHGVPTAAGKLASLAVSTSNTMIYFNYNTDNNWETFTVTASGLSGFKKSLVSLTPGASTEVKGILLGNDGIIYEFYRSNSTSTPVYNAVTTSATNFTDISTSNSLTTGVFYGFDATSKTIYRIEYSGATAVATATTGSVSPAVINSISVNTTGTAILLAGNDGALYRSSSSISTSSITWQNNTNKVVPLSINDVAAVGTNNAVAVGNDGTQWYSTNGGSNWTLAVNNTGVKLNAIALDATQTGMIAGNDGKLFNVNNAITATPSLTQITTGITSNLKDVALQGAGTAAYAVAQNGKAVFVSNYLTSTSGISSLAYNTNGALNGVSFVPGSFLALTVGDKSGVMMFAGSTGSLMNQVFTKPLQSVSFFDNNNGYVVDNGSILRHTTNGGNTWNVVLPNATLPAIAKVNARSATKALIVGANQYVAQINNESIPVTIAAPGITSDFKDFSFNGNGYGVIIGSNAWAARIIPAGSTYTVSSIGQAAGGGFDFNAVHVFNNVNNTANDKHFIAAGTNGKIYYYNTTGGYISQNNLIPSSTVFNDIYFRDDRIGYVVGNDGAAYKCVLDANIDLVGTTGSTAVVWNPLCTLAVYNGRTAGDVNFNTIAFSGPVNGFLAGNFDATGNHLHAVLLNDESMMYSTRFWYDKLGRMVISQNTKQYAKTPHAFSYTLYDELGRIKEVAEKAENTSVSKHAEIFGTNVNGFYNTKVIDDAKLLTWITDPTGARTEVTKTYYDVTAISGLPITQDNLRKRVASVTYEDVYDNNDLTYQHATHYTYDIHGNVKTLLQDNKKLFDEATLASSSIVNQRFKQIDYDYDLISGKVNRVTYQPNSTDQFIHMYTYDSDNRITKVETSTDNVVWDIDAKYFYYAHGPLARTEFGSCQVQGMDYAYTLQGWIKGVNSNTLDKSRDIGIDGYNDTITSNPNQNFAKDGFGYTLNYYQGDYKAIDYLKWNDVTKRFEANTVGSDLTASTHDLHDGNISSMVTTIVKPTITPGDTLQFIPLPQGTAYKYDQLNRLTEMKAWQNLSSTTNEWESGLAYAGMYNNKFTYDANGSLLTALAKNQAGQTIDNQDYRYQTIAGKKTRNRVYAINDSATITSGNDLLDQIAFDNTATTINSVNNYAYTEIGEMKSNKQDSIDLITWTLYGKLKSVTRSSGSTKKNVTFDYDASSNRIAKHVYTSANVWISSEYYVRNASGEIMSTYKYQVVDSSMSFAQTEKQIYGLSLVGIDKTQTEMISALPTPNPFSHTLGNKHYTGNNHLGNVLVTFTDRKLSIDSNSDGIIDEYWPDVISSNDYAPFGGALTERTFNKNTFPNSFNGKRDDKELNMQDYGMRPYMQDARFVPTMDPLTKKYPELSPYQFASNNPIWNIDLDGLEGTPYSNLGQSDPNKRVGTYNTDWGFATAASAGQASNQGGRITGTKYYNYSLPWTNFYLWQKPVPRVVTTTNVDPNIPPGNPVNQPPVNVVRNINFNPMSPVLTAGGTNQVNQIAAMAAPTQVVQANGAAMPQPPVVQQGVNSEGLPMTTTTQQTIQPVQQINTTSTITVNLATSLPAGAASTNLLNQRFAAISAQLQAQGIAPGNIVQGAQNFGVAGLPNGNQTNFQINTTTTTANGSQSTTTTTVSDSTYEKTE